jgi:hypothetical protein
VGYRVSGLTLSEIREALATTIRNNVDRQVTVRAYPPGVDGPSVLIEPATDYVDYHLSFGSAGLAAVRFVVTVDPGGTEAESAAIRLDDFCSVGTGNGSSMVDAIQSDRTLGLVGCDVFVESIEVDANTITARFSVTVNISKIGASA